MNSSELLTLFRSEMNDIAEPYLWSDEEVIAFMDDAQKWFCRKTDGLADTRSLAVCKLNIVPGTEWYDTSKLILHIRKATRDDTGQNIDLMTVEQADTANMRFTTQQGKLRNLVRGFEPHVLRTFPVPNETVTVTLSVFRLPLLSITDGDQAFEIDEQHHNSLLHWMKHRAYDKQDAETFDKRKSEDFRAQFLAYCATAKQEQERARRVLGSVAYGGI